MKRGKGRPRHEVPRNERYKSLLVNYELKDRLDQYKKILGTKTYAELLQKFMEITDKSI